MALRKRQWKTLCKRASVRYRPPGQMPHTFASMALMAGESPQWVAAQMGHRDWTFTARVYYRRNLSPLPSTCMGIFSTRRTSMCEVFDPAQLHIHWIETTEVEM